MLTLGRWHRRLPPLIPSPAANFAARAGADALRGADHHFKLEDST